MEKFLLGGILAGDKLDVVYQKHVGFPVFLMKGGGCPMLDRVDQLVGEIVSLYV